MESHTLPEQDQRNQESLLAQALERCAAEPIHLVGAVQSHGVLLAFDADGTIRMASDNLQPFFGRSAGGCLGRPVAEFIGDSGFTAARAHLAGLPERSATVAFRIRRKATGRLQQWSAIAHAADGLTVLELKEEARRRSDSTEQLFLAARHSLWLFDGEEDLDAYCAHVADEMRRMTGFDRVKIYRFDHNWNGEVIAESRNDRLPGLLGHHFPARDIPPQARALYEQNLVRVLADTEAATVPVLPDLNPLTGQPLNLGRSVLRAISPIHIDYLRNMGVRSTVTVSLMHEGRLWGLIACHNASPVVISNRLRELIEFVGKTISMKLSALGNAARVNYMDGVRQRLQRLTDLVRTSSKIGDIDVLLSSFRDDYLSLAGASGSYVRLENDAYRIGTVPSTEQLDALIAWVRTQDLSAGLFATNALGSLYPPAREYAAIASGLLVIPLDDRGSNFLFWFRPEVVRNIPWAGNPEGQVSFDADGRPRIDPRRSFAVWLETAHGQADPWSNATIDAVKLFSFSVVQLLMRQSQQRVDHADASNRAKSEFLANMSHEIRTPMNAIIGFTHLCLQSDISQQNRDRLDKIRYSANSLLRILNDILDLSKIEAGRLVLEETVFDLDQVLDNVGMITAIQAQEKDLEFVVDVKPECPSYLIGDPLRLEQVLINIAGNAVKFTQHGEIVMSGRVVGEEGEYLELRFDISDTGIGMSREQMANLFRPFTQADGSTTRKYGGTGLGLSISRHLVGMMGGAIDVDSELGKGSHFSFTGRFKRPSEHNASHGRQKLQMQLHKLRGMSVLLVDDNARARAVARQYLESFSFEVVEAGDGETALQHFAAGSSQGAQFDLVIVDWEMPALNGVETARRIAELATPGDRPRTMIVSMHHHEQSASLSPFVDAMLSKPFTASRLFNTIAGMFGQLGTAPEDQQSGPSVDHMRGAHVLLVEDNEINQQVASQILERAGIRVSIAEDGEEAVKRVRSGAFDGVLMDIHMPVMDGYEATRQIRLQHDASVLPIIAMTANAMVGDREKCLLAGMNDHISKPVDPAEMYATMAHWIRPRGLPAPTAEAPPGAPANPVGVLPHLPGFHVDEALHRLGGDAQAYLTLLARFRQRNRNCIAEIRLAMMACQPRDAERIAHTLKSTAGTLGAHGLQTKAAELEIRIRDGGELSKFERLLESAEGELASLLKTIDQALSTVGEAGKRASSASGECGRLPELLGKALQLLAAYDTGAEEAILAVEGRLPASEEIGTRMQRVRAQLAQYDYEGAGAELAALAGSLGLGRQGDEGDGT